VIVSPVTGGALGAAGDAERAGAGTSSMGGSGTDAQPASVAAIIPTIANHAKVRPMLVILLEALLALAVLLLIVWWTMFAGRKGGEPPREGDNVNENSKDGKD
jgi:hypothetical protein